MRNIGAGGTILDLIARGPEYLKGKGYRIELRQHVALHVHASGLIYQTCQRSTYSSLLE
jgi:hypothetical protein